MELNDDVFKDLIGVALTSSKDIPYITARIPLDSFPNSIYKEIYKAIIDLYNLGVEVDIVTVSNRLLQTSKLKDIGGRKVINSLALEAPSSFHCKSIVDSCISQILYRKAINMVDDFKSSISTTEDISSTCLEYCSKITNTIQGDMDSDKLYTISDGIEEVLNDLKSCRQSGCMGLDCGFNKMNYFLGGLQKGKMYVIGARPSMGKSALAMNIAEYVSKNKNVLFESLEMSRKEYAQRLMLGRSGVDISMVNTGRISDLEIQKVQREGEYLNSLNLFIETHSPCRISNIELDIINLKSTRGSCDLVIIDYLQLLSSKGSSKNRENEVAELSREIKSLAMKYNIPIIVLSQLSRALESREDKRPMLSDLRESGAIEQDADVVMFVYRDEWYHPDNPASRGKGEILIRKNRGGMNNIDLEMCWRGREVRFMEALEYDI